MREPHYGHAGTVYDGKMYISGGITHDSFQKELLCYDPGLDTWEQRSPMTGMISEFFNQDTKILRLLKNIHRKLLKFSVVRGLHCMTTFRDKLFVIGGNHFRGSTDYDDVLGNFFSFELLCSKS